MPFSSLTSPGKRTPSTTCSAPSRSFEPQCIWNWRNWYWSGTGPPVISVRRTQWQPRRTRDTYGCCLCRRLGRNDRCFPKLDNSCRPHRRRMDVERIPARTRIDPCRFGWAIGISSLEWRETVDSTYADLFRRRQQFHLLTTLTEWTSVIPVLLAATRKVCLPFCLTSGLVLFVISGKRTLHLKFDVGYHFQMCPSFSFCLSSKKRDEKHLDRSTRFFSTHRVKRSNPTEAVENPISARRPSSASFRSLRWYRWERTVMLGRAGWIPCSCAPPLICSIDGFESPGHPFQWEWKWEAVTENCPERRPASRGSSSNSDHLHSKLVSSWSPLDHCLNRRRSFAHRFSALLPCLYWRR